MGSTPYEGYEGDKVMAAGDFGMSGHVRYDADGNALTAADLERIQAEQERQAREEKEDRPDVQDTTNLGPLRPSQVSKSGGSRRVSGSRTYDYTGMDEAAKVAQALQAAEGSFIGVAMDDPMKIPQLQNSIRSMQQYLADYRAGRGLPPVRVRSENASASVSAGGGGRGFTRDDFGTDRTYNDKEEEQQEGGQAVQVFGPAPPPVNRTVDGGGVGGNQQLILDGLFGIPQSVDANSDPQFDARRNREKSKTQEPEQGPVLPGLNR